MAKSKIDDSLRGRLKWVLLFFFSAIILLIGRLFLVQIVYHKEYADLASRQQSLVSEIFSERGAIYAGGRDDSKVPFALNKVEKNLIASPRNIRDAERSAEIIAETLALPQDEVLGKISPRDDPYEIVAKRLAPKDAESLIARLPSGFFLEEELRRIYPHKTLGAHLVGFVSKEKDQEEGKYGLEKSYEEELAGIKGFFEGAKSASGFLVALARRVINPPRNGAALLLSVDYNIQLKAEEILEGIRKKWDGALLSVLIMEPKTGKILAMASRPVFDSNEFSKEDDFSVFLNPTVESMFELGSVLKPITLAAALEEKLIGRETTYEDSGEVRIGSYSIKNFDGKAYRKQTMTQVIEKSLNTGAVYVSRLLGKERHEKYLKLFGFGEKTGVDLPGEVAGDISNLEDGRDIDFATASFGQGIAVTQMQLASAIGALANGGKLMKPYVVEKIIDDSGNEVNREPEIIRQVISSETAEEITKMLVSAVRNGFENRAGVKGYFVAGKTGTAQIPREAGRGYSDKVIHTFVGYAPAFNPRFLILLQLNEPKGNRFAANTLTPAFHDLAEYILNYYEVPPDEK